MLLYDLDLNLIDLVEAYLLFRAERNVESISQPLKRKKKKRERKEKERKLTKTHRNHFILPQIAF